MRTHITNLYGHSPNSIAMIAQNTVADIARQLGFREIGIYSYPVQTDTASELRKRMDGMFASVGNNDIVIVQSPSWNSTEFDEIFVNRLKLYHNIKIIIFIHDIVPLMFKSNEYLMEQTIETYNKADLLVVPSEKMLSELRRRGLKTEKIVIQHMWDHPTSVIYHRPKFARKIQFAGSPQRFSFVNDWHYEIPLHLYTTDSVSADLTTVINEGWKAEHELLNSLATLGGFGLVWSQQTEEKYYELNNSYKLSTYIAAGIPVIVQDTLSNCAIIKDNHLGLVVTSLEEAVKKLSTMTEEEYNAMVEAVQNYRELIINGYFTKKLLIDSVHSVLSITKPSSEQ